MVEDGTCIHSVKTEFSTLETIGLLHVSLHRMNENFSEFIEEEK